MANTVSLFLYLGHDPFCLRRPHLTFQTAYISKIVILGPTAFKILGSSTYDEPEPSNQASLRTKMHWLIPGCSILVSMVSTLPNLWIVTSRNLRPPVNLPEHQEPSSLINPVLLLLTCAKGKAISRLMPTFRGKESGNDSSGIATRL